MDTTCGMKTIRQLRHEQHLTQLALAITLGVSPATIHHWERGRYQPRAAQLRALARVLGTPMDAICLTPETARTEPQ